MARLTSVAERLIRPTTKAYPDDWARANRVYPESAGVPGPREPSLTPYVIAFMRAVQARRARLVVLVTAAQSGKTDSILDILGSQLDQRPLPMIYAGPTRDFVVDQFEPRVTELIEQCESLAAKALGPKQQKKTLKRVAGVRLRLAHAGSSSALKSDPAALAVVDEYDEMLANVRGQGDPVGLLKARGETYADFIMAVTSTPSLGLVETEVERETGLEFWRPAPTEDISSGIWKLWQEGTRYHWAWPCTECDGYFIPRLKQLRWPKGATPSQAKREAYLECPLCGGIMTDADKAKANERGRYVAPGQKILADGTVSGDPPESSTISFWVSGLASPFRSFGERAETYLLAFGTGEDAKIQTATNTSFGECYSYAMGSDTMDWHAVKARSQPYSLGEVPNGAIFLTAGVDVQARRLIYAIRGWGSRATSWLVERGEIWGLTHEAEVWEELLKILTGEYGGLPIRRAFIDSGFRPGKAQSGDDHAVYEFARRYPWLVYATKGHDTRIKPLSMSTIEVDRKGKASTSSIQLVHLDTDFFKSWVHSAIRMPPDRPGGFFIPQNIDEDYCRQVASEHRIVSAETGRPTWIAKSRENHYLDCEAMALAAAYLHKVQQIPEGVERAPTGPQTEGQPPGLRQRMSDRAARLKR